MGFGNVAGQVIMFLAIITIVGVAFQTTRMNTVQTSTALREQRERYEVLFNTRLEIKNVSFTNETNPCTTTVTIKNTGNSKLTNDFFDVYINGSRVPENNIETKIFDLVNPNIFDPGEYIEINASLNISKGNHLLEVLTKNGYRTSTIYTTASGCLVQFECITSEDCDDNNDYTLNFCSNNYCVNIPIECLDNSDCDDGNESTANICNNNVCEYIPYECTLDIDCDDEDPYTIGTCVDNICSYELLECLIDEDCDDEDASTSNNCIDNSCVFIPIESDPGTCSDNSDCEAGETCIYGECWSNVVAFWSYDNDDNTTAFDSSPNSLDADYEGSAFSGEGKKNNALHISSNDDYVDKVYTSELNFQGKSEISISMWVNINSSTGWNNGYHLLNAPGSHRSTYSIEKFSSGGFRFILDLGSTTILEWDRDLHGRYPVANQWYHIVGTYDGNNMKIYIDGSLSKILETTGTISSIGVNNIYIGAGSGFSGMIDETIIFNKSLTPEEITKLYNLGE